MSGQRPVVKGVFEAVVEVSGAVMSTACFCGRAAPLALMKIRLALRPDHSNALIPARTVLRASKPNPLLPITSLSPSMLIALAAKAPFAAPLRPSGRDRPVVVLAAPRHQREDDARDLVCERHRGQLELGLDGLALEHPARPTTQGVVMARAMAEVAQAPTTRSLRK